MHIGVPKETKNHEYRVGLTPAGVSELVQAGHQVLVETSAGAAIGMSDADYTSAGARIAANVGQVFAEADLLIKVKEPQPDECRLLRPGQTLFTYLHLAPDPMQTRLLLDSGAIAIAYETVTAPDRTLPLLAPMSEVAGRLSVQAGAHCLEQAQGGAGVLLGGVPGVAPAKVLVIGGGVVGDNAAAMALGMGADVTLLDCSLPRLRQLDAEYGGRVKCIYSTRDAIEEYALQSELIIGAVLKPGATAPKLIGKDLVTRMKPGSVLVDVAIDQGGCFETSRPSTHQDPTYVVDGVVHYCVANMPGAVPRTSTLALNNATMPYIRALTDKGVRPALMDDQGLRNGLNVYQGRVTCEAVAQDLHYDYFPAVDALAA
ncbi:MAG: alanine dehydrogenase [Gammaproteobacteria bacterium]|nr:alanine dehydrogenase [Gammaproteobacteria bacterium]